MALLELDAPQTGAEAELLAGRNWDANLQALVATQAELATSLSRPTDLSWTFARDGFLSAKDASGQWISRCSLPQRAAREMLKEMKLRAAVGCFIGPNHAAQLQLVVDELRPNQSIIAIVESMSELSLILSGHDFSADISGHRLFFAAGADWPEELDRLLTTYGGLPTPGTFIRLITTPQEVAERVIAKAQGIFSNISSSRAQEIQRLVRQRPSGVATGKPRVCAVAASQFRLWDDAGHALASVVQAISDSADIRRVDPDDPASSSPLAVALAGSECQCLVAANFSRADAPQVLPADVPWISWLTAPVIPSYAPAGPGDQLLLADPAWVGLAVEAGWPRDRVHVAAWPTMKLPAPSSDAPLAIIADTLPVAATPVGFELSSHGLLWELIYNELNANPFLLEDIGRYLKQRMGRLHISNDNFDHRRFIDELIVPVYQQAMARTIVSAKLPVTIHGNGWDRIAEFAGHAAGPIKDRAAFDRAIKGCGALIDVWPVAQPATAAYRPLVRSMGSRESLLRNARSALARTISTPPTSAAALSGPLLARIMGVGS